MTFRTRIVAGLCVATLAGLLGQTLAAVAWFSGNGTRSISGVVTDTRDGRRLSGVCVIAYDSPQDPTVNGQIGRTRFKPEAITDANGRYTLGRLASGVYRLTFRSCSGPVVVVPEWWSNQPTYELAKDLRVPPDRDLAGINASIRAL